MSFPEPQVGLVIRYSFLWSHEARLGREEGSKDRPCAIVVMLVHKGQSPIIRVVPVTHVPPNSAETAMELPPQIKLHLGLDADHSWIVLDEANDFTWPGPDLRLILASDVPVFSYGMLPSGFMKVLEKRLIERSQTKNLRITRRSQ